MQNSARVVYCGTEDSFFKKLSHQTKDLILEAKPANFSGSPQAFARSKRAGVLLLKIRHEFDSNHQGWLSRSDGSVPIIVVCQNGTVKTAIHALQYGIFDYFCASQGLDEIAKRIRDAVLWSVDKIAKRSAAQTDSLFMGNAPSIAELTRTARELADGNKSVLILGEAGTGKEHLAAEMFRLSGRKEMPFLQHDCRILQQISKYDGLSVSDLIQIYLQPAKRKHDACALFLSHVEDLIPEQLQEIFDRCRRSSVWLFSSYQEQGSGFVAERAPENIPSLRIPPVRQHPEDIPLMVDVFLRKAAHKHAVPLKSITEETLLLMKEYSWPGNAQELTNIVEQMTLVEPSPVLRAGTWRICNGHGMKLNVDGANQFSTLLETVLETNAKEWKDGALYDGFMQRMEKILIRMVLPKVENNQALAAKVLGISRNTLRRRLKTA